jgi:outer membrane immunogenic protein
MGDETMTFKWLGTGAAALGFLAGSIAAQAADFPRPIYKSAPPVSYFNWSGAYIGINGGYGFDGTSDWAILPGLGIKPKGGMIGGTLGYNMQVGGVVLGLEGDADWSDVSGRVDCVPGFVTCGTKSDWLATFRARIGYAFDRWMPYITGGGAVGNVKATASAPILGATFSASNSQVGWTAGGGFEYAFLGNWSAKVEYLFVDLGSFDSGIAPIANNVSFKENIIRAGINYRFTGPIINRF